MRRIVIFAAVLLGLSACALDTEEELKAELGPRLYILETMHFASKSSCTAAVYTLALGAFRKDFPVVQTLEDALARVKMQVPVRFALEGMTPHEITEAIMSRDLPNGLGLISSGIGPARDCLDDKMRRGYTRVLQREATQLVYLPQDNALLLLYPPERLAFFLRGNV